MSNILTLHWDTLHLQAKEELLSGACFNTRLAHYKWAELKSWIQADIQDSLKQRSKGIVSIEA